MSKPFGGRGAGLAGAFLSVVFLAAPSGTLAHDFWIEPERFQPVVGTKLALRLYVGQHFKGDSIPYLPEWFERFVYIDPRTREHSVGGIAGDDPAGQLAIDTPGLYIVGYHSSQFAVDFVPKEFAEYLVKEGLERILPLHQARSARTAKIHETYSRYAKALIAAGKPAADLAADRAFGFPLELIAERNPYLPLPGQALPVRLRYRREPLSGALVIAFNRQDPAAKLKARTDANGRVILKLTRPGVWLVTAVHMISPPENSKADWESLWASLIFELPPP